jgi:hypothetical protein
MKRNDDTAAKAAMVIKRLGNTTGASKGSKPLPKPKIKVRPTGGLKPSGIKGTVTIKW